MRLSRGISILEVLVACMILVFVVGATTASYVSMKQISRNLGYHYTAMNLIKDVLEFGEAGTFGHKLAMKYYYPGATSNSIPESLDCGASGINTTAGYGVKEWRCFAMGNPQPFMYIGDIKAKGLVPKRAPDSVVIYFRAEQDANFDNTFKETATISWQDDEGGEQRKVEVSVIPIRSVNDQLRLTTSEFWWD